MHAPGGTFALYSLLCRHAKLNLILNQQTADAELSTYQLEQLPETPRGERLRKLLEKHSCLRTSLLVIVLLGTCMVIGDGILTPSIAGLASHFVDFTLAMACVKFVHIWHSKSLASSRSKFPSAAVEFFFFFSEVLLL